MHVKGSFYTTLSQRMTVVRTEETRCNLCGGADRDKLDDELGFGIWQCRDCGLVYVSPQPCAEELPRFYEEMYPDADEATVAARGFGWVERHIAAIVARRKPKGGRFLEVGCGYGALLEALSTQPLELHGLELSETAAAYARARVPAASIQTGPIEDAAFPPASFNVIALIAVLEHVKDPRAVLERLAALLAPGGLLIVQVPYPRPYITLKRIFPRLPVSFEAPRHLYGFSPATLERYFREAGLTAIRTEVARPYSGASRLHAALIWAVKIPGIVLAKLTAGRWIYPFAAAIVTHGVKK